MFNIEDIKFKCIPVCERYYNSDSSYGVFVFHTKDEIPEYDPVPESPFQTDTDGLKMSMLVGNMQQLYIGSEYEVVATLDYNAKYKSYQYKPKIITSVTPKTEEQQKMFLTSIITEKQAETLLNKYPNIVEDIIKGTDKVDLKELKGIGEITYNSIKEKILENYVISDILVLLQPLGVKYPMVKKLLMGESNPALLKEKLLDNPYIMLDLKGFGFKTVDSLALKLNPGIKISAKRTYAFIKYYLKEIGNNQGHTWVNIETLENAVRDNIPECMDVFEKLISSEKENEIILHFGGDKVGLNSYYQLERDVFNILKEIQKYPELKLEEENVEDGIKQAEKEQGFDLTDEQKQVVKSSLNDNVCIIAGKAGTGKSTISRALLNIYKHAGYSISCCALSAKAAQRITEATGFQASTIHRLLGVNPQNGFEHNHENPLDANVILIDECSMINSYVYYAIVSAVKEGAKLIMCGDNRQLPPIGYGNIFSDLLLKTDHIHISHLTKVLRQAEKSGILSDANKIREGVMPISQPELKIVNGELQDMTYMFRDTKEGLKNIAIKSYLKAIEQDGTDEVIIITPRKENCENSTLELNIKLSDILLDKKSKTMKLGKKEYLIGSKVMQIDNNYEKNVFNGEVGYITKIEEVQYGKDKTLEFTVEFKLNDQTKKVIYSRNELDQLDLAYAMTIHKSQGSGYKTVIILIDMTHYTLLDTCLLYTAITRAKKRCLLLAEPAAFKMCMDNNKSKNRQTWLKEM